MQKAQKPKIDSAIEVLNFYRNRYYNTSSDSQEYKLANAINDILPLIKTNTSELEFDRSCPNCFADIDFSWRHCPFCGQYVPSADEE